MITKNSFIFILAYDILKTIYDAGNTQVIIVDSIQ